MSKYLPGTILVVYQTFYQSMKKHREETIPDLNRFERFFEWDDNYGETPSRRKRFAFLEVMAGDLSHFVKDNGPENFSVANLPLFSVESQLPSVYNNRLYGQQSGTGLMLPLTDIQFSMTTEELMKVLGDDYGRLEIISLEATRESPACFRDSPPDKRETPAQASQ